MSYKDLKSGDSFVIIKKDPILDENGNHVVVGGNICEFFELTEAGRVFFLTHIQQNKDGSWSYQGVYIGILVHNAEKNEYAVVDSDGKLVGGDNA